MNPEEETLFASALLKAASAVLDLLPIAYAIRIETSENVVYERSRPAEDTLPSSSTGFGPDVENLPRA